MSEIPVSRAVDAPVAKPRLVWIDVLKGLAILAVLAHHYAEPGVNFKVLLSAQGFAPSLNRMWEVSLQHSRSELDAALVVISGLGYQGVHLFLVASGFSLALASVNRSRPLSYGAFLKRRVARLLPPYWIVVLLLGVIGAVLSLTQWKIPWLIGSSKSDLFINLFLLRNFAEKWVWIYPGALWFVPLIVQLYLLLPPLMSAMQKRPQSTLIACAVLTVVYRAFAVFVLDGKPVGISVEGASTPLMFCLARLLEFAFGMWLAVRFAQSGHILTARNLGLVALMGTLIWMAGVVLTCHRLGFVVGEPLIGVGLFLWVYVLAKWMQDWKPLQMPLSFLGRRSYSLFLMHSILVPTPLSFASPKYFVPGFLLYCAVACVLAVVLDFATDFVMRLAANRHVGDLARAASAS